MYQSPFDDDLTDAYAALEVEANVPLANRRALIQRYAPRVGLGMAAVVVVGFIGIAAWHARQGAATVVPAAHAVSAQPSSPEHSASSAPSPPTEATVPRTAPDGGAMALTDPTAPGVSPPGTPMHDVQDLALRFAYVWANRGGGLDPSARTTQLAMMRGQDPNKLPADPTNDGLQVVLSAHVAKIEARDAIRLVTVSLLMAGTQAPQWAGLQLALAPATASGWTVVGEPVWVPIEPSSGPVHTPPSVTWVDPEQSASREILTAFFTQFAAQPVVHEPGIVAHPIRGLNGFMAFDRLEGVASDGDPHHLYARVRWVTSTGIPMSQVYLLGMQASGGIDSVEVAGIN